MQARSLLALAGFAGATAGAALLGARASKPGLWYALLRKPRWAPPKQAFGPVWTALYALIAHSGFRVFRAAPSRERTIALGLWGTQLALNAAWTPLFFAKHRAKLALADLGALLLSVGAYAFVARKVDRVAAAEFAPYGAWVGFAGALQASIVRRTPRLVLEARI